MALGNTDLTCFKDLLIEKKRIPQYQRDFVWEANLISTFLENIWDAFKDQKGRYFCGSLVVFDTEDNVYEIVDGQQRTTVLFTLVGLMISKLSEDDIDWRGEQRAKYIYSRPTKGVKEFHYTHGNKNIREFYEAIGNGEKFTPDGDGDIAVKTLLSCQEEVDHFLTDKIKEYGLPEIGEFYDYIINKVSFTHFLASDITEALMVYSRLNSGGKPLGHLEVIKGQLFGAIQNAGEKEWNDLEDLWNDFWIKFKTPIKIGGIGAARDLINDETFLAYFFFVNYPDEVNQVSGVKDSFLPSKKMIDFLLDPRIVNNIFSQPYKFVKDLIGFVDKLISFRLGEHENEKDANLLKDIALLSQTQTQPLMFLLTCSYDNKLLSKTLPMVMKLVFIFTISVTGTGSTSNIWKTLSKGVRERKETHTIDENISNLSSEFQNYCSQYWKSNFVPFINNCSYLTEKRQIKVILLMTEIAARNMAKISGSHFYNNFYYKQGYDVDHLKPKNLSNDEDFIHQIGNLAILGTIDNRALKDKPFEDNAKKSALSKSDIYTTRALVLNKEEELGAKKKIMDTFSTISIISSESVKKRESELIDTLGRFIGI